MLTGKVCNHLFGLASQVKINPLLFLVWTSRLDTFEDLHHGERFSGYPPPTFALIALECGVMQLRFLKSVFHVLFIWHPWQPFGRGDFLDLLVVNL